MHGSIAEMSAASRREKIVSLINARGRMHIAELVMMLGVSEMTIRHALRIWRNRKGCTAYMAARSLSSAHRQ